jgi:hypothetical protein
LVARPEGSPASGGGGIGAPGRGGAKYGKGKSSAEQCAAYGAKVRPRGGATSTHWLGVQAEARARQGLPGGGRGSSNSGEQAARPEQHAQGRATRTLVELEAAHVCEERQSEVEFTVSATGGGNGGSVCGKARGGEVSSFIGARALWRGSRESSPSGLRHGTRAV